MTLENLYYPVELQNLTTTTGLGCSQKAVVRTDTNQVISVVSDDYKLVRNEEVFPELLGILNDMGIEHQIRRHSIVNNGASAYLEVICPDEQFILGGKDKNCLRFILANSYDTTRSVSIILGAFRFICTNGMILGMAFASYRRKHIGEFDLSFSKDLFTDRIEQFRDNKHRWEKLYDQPLDRITGHNRIDQIQKKLNWGDRATNRVKDLWGINRDNERNVWGLYNCYTNEITHSRRNLVTQTQLGGQITRYFIKEDLS